MDVATKLCRKCNEVKPLSEFYVDATRNKVPYVCKCCKRKMAIAYYNEHKEERRAYNLAYWAKYGR